MPLANAVDAYYVRGQAMDALYAGSVRVWPQTVVPPIPGTISLTYDGALNAGNPVGFSVSGATTVDWGDGTAVESLAGNVAAAHTYPTTGTFVAVVNADGEEMTSFTNNPTQGIDVQQPTEIILDATSLVEVNVKSSGAGQQSSSDARRHLTRVEFAKPVVLASCERMFTTETLLVEIVGAFSSMGPDYTSMFSGCSALTTIPTLGSPLGVVFRSMFWGCTALTTVPPLDVSRGVFFDGMFSGCTALTTVSPMDTPTAADVHDMFLNCAALTAVPLSDTSSVGIPTNMFNGCAALTEIPALDMSSAGAFFGIFSGCDAVASNLAFGFTKSVSVSRSELDAAALNVFFTNLGIADNTSGQQTVTITGCPGAATCDRTIATAKGWTVTG